MLQKQENKRMQNLLQNTRVLDKQKKIALSVANKIEFVEIGSIIRCESESNYTTFHLKTGEKLIVSKTLKEFDELLTPHNFLRVHQSHLINLDEIKSFIKSDGGYIRMKDGSSFAGRPVKFAVTSIVTRSSVDCLFPSPQPVNRNGRSAKKVIVPFI